MAKIKGLPRPKSLTDTVAEQLRQAIVDGELAMGQALSEASLASQFGVSKTPVREALFILKQDGLVDIIPQKGSFVFQLDADAVNELCDYRVFLESQALKVAMETSMVALVEDLEICLVKMKRRFMAGDHKAFLQLDSEFHEVFFRHASNRFLWDSYKMVNYFIGALRSDLTRSETVSQAILDDHYQIFDKIAASDIDGATQHLYSHIGDIKLKYLEAAKSA